MADDLPPGFRVIHRPPASPVGPFPGMLQSGNVDLEHRPIAKNPDGSYSTVRSMSFGGDGGKEILVPTVSPDGTILSDDAAIDAYGKTGQTLGVFDTPEHADMYAGALHKAQEQFYGGQANAAPADDIPAGFKIVAPGPTAAPAVAPVADEQPSSLKDAALSFVSGIPRGVAETAMFPVTASRMIEQGGNWLYNKGENLVRSAIGADPLSDEELARRASTTFNGGPAYDAQDKARDVMDAVLYEPKTTAGKFAGTIGEFTAPGALPSKAARLAPTVADKAIRYAEEATGNVLAPALASEAAGQVTEGSPYEGVSRFLGALFGNTTAAATRAHYAPDAAIRRSTEGMTDDDWQKALDLQNSGTGIDLSSPEAVAQARGGASKLPDLLRIVEGSQTGGAITGPFFAARPAQVDTAVGGVLDKIAPQSAQPSVLGPRAADAATRALQEVEQARTAAVQPHYTAANADKVSEDTMRAILDTIGRTTADDSTGILAGPLNDLRSRLIETPANPGKPATRVAQERPNGTIYKTEPAIEATPEKPILDVENLDRARKYFRDRMDLPQIGQDAITKEQNAAVTGVLKQIDDAMEAASPEFAAGKQQYADQSRDVVQPVAEGPVGRVAATKDTAAASNAILPQNPLAGAGGETADAVQRLAAQDPETTAALVRQNLADRYAAAQTETQGGNREVAGAKFHKSVAGNDARQEVLDAVLNAIPGGQPAAAAMSELLDVLQATMRRKGEGSPTEVNRMNTAELGAASPQARLFDLAKSLGGSFLTQAGDATKRATLRNSMSALADILTGPNAVERTRAAADRRPRVSYPEAMGRTLLEAGQTLYDPRGGRKPLELTVTKKDKRQ